MEEAETEEEGERSGSHLHEANVRQNSVPYRCASGKDGSAEPAGLTCLRPA